jgi:hypothetical protein
MLGKKLSRDHNDQPSERRSTTVADDPAETEYAVSESSSPPGIKTLREVPSTDMVGKKRVQRRKSVACSQQL